MLNPDKKAIEALSRIHFNERAFVEYLESVVVDQADKLVSQVDEVQLRILQGRSQAIIELLGLIKKAPDLIRKA